MLAIALFISIIVSLFHLLLESAIMPNERLRLRYEFFELRDKLRWKAINEPDSISDEEYKALSSGINVAIGNMSSITPSILINARKEYETNDNYRKAVEKRRNLIDESESEFVKQINDRTKTLTFVALGINSGGWLIIILPVYIIYKIIASITRYTIKFRNKVFDWIRLDQLAYAPHYMMKQIIPNYEYSQNEF